MKTTRMPRPVRLRVTSKGFSLIELMVAMTVGLILIAGLAALFANSSQTGNDLERSLMVRIASCDKGDKCCAALMFESSKFIGDAGGQKYFPITYLWTYYRVVATLVSDT